MSKQNDTKPSAAKSAPADMRPATPAVDAAKTETPPAAPAKPVRARPYEDKAKHSGAKLFAMRRESYAAIKEHTDRLVDIDHEIGTRADASGKKNPQVDIDGTTFRPRTYHEKGLVILVEVGSSERVTLE